jgi:DNA-binding MarR family transcriptional regulator
MAGTGARKRNLAKCAGWGLGTRLACGAFMNDSMSGEEVVPGEAEHAPVFELLLVSAHRLAIELTAELEFEHVSVMGLLAVQMLSRPRPPRSPRELAAALGCSRPAATQLVNRLVSNRIVERTVDPDDRRARQLTLTKDGRAYGGFALDVLQRCMAAFTVEFSAEDKASLHSLLARLQRGTDWHRSMRLWGPNRLPPGRGPAVHIR